MIGNELGSNVGDAVFNLSLLREAVRKKKLHILRTCPN